MQVQHKRLEWVEGKVKGFFGKDLMRLDNGTLKLIKIAPLSNYPEHLHPDVTEYAFVLQGAPGFIINGKSFKGLEGDFFMFPRGQKHAILNDTDHECLLLVGAVAEPEATKG